MASLQSRLTAKAGPLPVWAWAVLALAAFYLYSHRSTATAAPVAPSTPANTSIAPSSGQGNAADNMNSDALAALLGSYDQMLSLNSNLLNAITSAPYGTSGSFNTTTTNTYNTTGFTVSGPPAGGSGVPLGTSAGAGGAGGGYPGGYVGADQGASGGIYNPGSLTVPGTFVGTRQAAAPPGKTYIS